MRLMKSDFFDSVTDYWPGLGTDLFGDEVYR